MPTTNSIVRNADPKGHESRPVFSIVLPTHNRAQLLEEAVDSVLCQTFPDWELVIVDDVSSPPVVNYEEVDPRIRLIRHEDSHGGAGSKATGASTAQGEFVAFLDDDDLFSPTFLADVLTRLRRHPEIEVLFVGVEWFGLEADQQGKPHATSLQWVLEHAQPMQIEHQLFAFDQKLLTALLRKVPMPFQRPVVRKSTLDGIGLHARDCLLWDCDWALRAAMVAQCAFLGLPLYRQRAEAQGYFSRPGTEIAQAASEFEIAHRLYHANEASADHPQREELRVAMAKRAYGLARIHAEAGNFLPTLRYWSIGQRTKPDLRAVRTLALALLRLKKRFISR